MTCPCCLCVFAAVVLSPFPLPGVDNYPLSADSNQITPQGPARSPAPPRSLLGPLKLGFPSPHTPGEGSLPEKQRSLAVQPGPTPWEQAPPVVETAKSHICPEDMALPGMWISRVLDRYHWFLPLSQLGQFPITLMPRKFPLEDKASPGAFGWWLLTFKGQELPPDTQVHSQAACLCLLPASLHMWTCHRLAATFLISRKSPPYPQKVCHLLGRVR